MNLNCTEEIVLENERALLKPLSLSHLEILMPVAVADKTLLQFSPAPVFSEPLLRKYLEKAMQERAVKSRYPFIVYDKPSGRFAGSTSFLTINNEARTIQIGATWIGRDFQKTGLNRQCKALLLCYAFDKLQFERVEFRTDERNIASRKAIEKIGGKQEGILRSDTIMSDGFRRNTVVYSILKGEWKGFLA